MHGERFFLWNKFDLSFFLLWISVCLLESVGSWRITRIVFATHLQIHLRWLPVNKLRKLLQRILTTQVPVSSSVPAPVVEVKSSNENSQATTENNRGDLSNTVFGVSRGGYSTVSRHNSRGRTTYAGMAAIGGRTVEPRRVLFGSRSTDDRMASREPNDGSEEEGSDEDGFVTQVSRNQRRRNQKAWFYRSKNRDKPTKCPSGEKKN